MKTIPSFNLVQRNIKLYSSVVALLVFVALTSCEKEEVNATVLGEYVGSYHIKSYDYSSRALTRDTTFTNARILVQKGEKNNNGFRKLKISVFPSLTSTNMVFRRSDILLLNNTSLEDRWTEHGPLTTIKRGGSFANDSLNFKHQYLKGSDRVLLEEVIKAVRVKRGE